MKSQLLIGLFLVQFSLNASAADWPQWRGPHRDGISAEIGLLEKWPQDGPKMIWQSKDVGEGYATPAVVGERIYLVSNKGTEDEFLQALDVKGGEQLWATRLGKVGPNRGPQYPAARSTPTIDGELLYALGSDGDLVCLETSTGKERWHKNLRDDFRGMPGNWAYAESPLIDGDVLVCTPGGSEATLIALNKKNADTIWRASLPTADQAAYASVVVAETGGIRQYVQFLEKGLVGVDAKTGKLLWRYEKTAAGSPANIPTPIIHDDCVYSSAARSGGGLVKLKAHQGDVEAEPIYFQGTLPTSIGGGVVVDGYLYGTNGQGLVCAEFTTGDMKWQNRSIGPSSICYADGRLYLHGENGDAALVEATPEEYREVGRFTPPDQPAHTQARAKAWAYPVVANGRLYLRDQGSLWCYEVEK